MILTIFREVRDPRDWTARHSLAEILFITLAATLCGAKSFVDIADFAAGREEDLREILDLKHGVPSHDTLSRVFRLLDPTELERALVGFTTALRQALGIAPAGGVVAVDGKSLRRGYEKGQSHFPPLMVSLWDAETRLAIASKRAPGGSETKATLELLKGVVLKGCTVTADALHCHPAMAAGVLATKAQYVLGLKGNNGPLFEAAIAGFAKAAALPSFETQDQAHGRRERRRASVLPASRLPGRSSFPGLKAIGRIESERTDRAGKTDVTVRYFALSKKLAPRMFVQVARSHWSIENQHHWPLDVVFHEDDARTRKDYGPQNLAVVRRIAQNILNAHPLEIRLASKVRRARWNKEFFFELFAYMR